VRYLGCTADEVEYILDVVDSAQLTCCVDLGHAHLLTEGAEQFTERFAGRIGHVQLTDNDGVHDQHLALGEGTLDVASCFRQLKRLDYTGSIAIELSDRAKQLRSLAYLGSLFGGEQG
jgi:sugar phosphate isomerase/epimerase